MDVSIGHFCLIYDFLDVGFNTNKISERLKPDILKLMRDYNLTIPEDWKLIFEATYNNGIVPLVAKNKVGSYPSDKMKYVKIVIPIPLKSEIEWGVDPEQHLYKKDHYDKLMKNFRELDVDYRQYTNRTDYITACLKAGVGNAFEEGFTVGKSKLQIKAPVRI